MTDTTFDNIAASGSSTRRFAIGASGGLAAVCAKYVSQDHAYIMNGLNSTDDATKDAALSFAYTYPILAGVLVLVGGLVGWASDEGRRWRLFTMGVAGPAMISTFASGGWAANASPQAVRQGMSVIEHILPATTAQAGEAQVILAQGTSVTKGIQLFFGIGREVPRYSVVAGPYSDRAEAEAVADRINDEMRQANARIGEQTTDGSYPVVLGENLPHATAEQLRSEVEAHGLVRDLHIATGE